MAHDPDDVYRLAIGTGKQIALPTKNGYMSFIVSNLGTTETGRWVIMGCVIPTKKKKGNKQKNDEVQWVVAYRERGKKQWTIEHSLPNANQANALFYALTLTEPYKLPAPEDPE